MTWLTLLAIYFLAGLLVFAYCFVLDRLQKQSTPKESILAIFLWPLAVTKLPEETRRALARRHIPAIPKYERRAHSIQSFIKEMQSYPQFSDQLLQLLTGGYSRLEHGEEISSFGVRVAELNMLDKLGLKVNGIAEETERFYKERVRQRENQFQKTGKRLFVSYTSDNHVFLTPSFERSVSFLTEENRRQLAFTVREIAHLTGDLQRGGIDGITGADRIRLSLKMNGPIPCVIVNESVAVVFEPEQACFVGIVARVDAIRVEAGLQSSEVEPRLDNPPLGHPYKYPERDGGPVDIPPTPAALI